MNDKKLVKSPTDRMICGVCGGIAEYIGIDPTVVRILWVIFSLMGSDHHPGSVKQLIFRAFRGNIFNKGGGFDQFLSACTFLTFSEDRYVCIYNHCIINYGGVYETEKDHGGDSDIGDDVRPYRMRQCHRRR